MARKKYGIVEQVIKLKISTKLKKILNQKGITQKELSEMTGLATSTISDYCNGCTMVSPGNLQIITDALQVKKSDIDELFSGSDIEEAQTIKIPVYEKISCGNGSIVCEQPVAFEVTPKEWVSGGAYFYLRAKGDSMIGARINDGDLLLIRKQPTIEDGEIAAVLLDDEAVIKKVFFRNDNVILQSENPAYPPKVISKGNMAIIGKLKKVIINI